MALSATISRGVYANLGAGLLATVFTFCPLTTNPYCQRACSHLEEGLQLFEIEVDGLAMGSTPDCPLLWLLDFVPVELLQAPLLCACGRDLRQGRARVGPRVDKHRCLCPVREHRGPTEGEAK